jgi:hypothetical protein
VCLPVCLSVCLSVCLCPSNRFLLSLSLSLSLLSSPLLSLVLVISLALTLLPFSELSRNMLTTLLPGTFLPTPRIGLLSVNVLRCWVL